LALWLKANQGVSGTTAVTQWDDQSGMGHNTEAVVGTPSRQDNALNYNPVVEFNSTSYFTLTSFSTGYSAGEAIAVVSGQVTKNGFPYFLGGSGGQAHYTWSDGIVYQPFGSSVRRSINPSVDISQFNIFGTYAANNDWGAGFNGGLDFSTATNIVSFAGATSYIGATAGSAPRGLDGQVAEVILYNRKLNLAERQQVNSYLALKYGITLTGTQGISYTASDGTVVWDADANAAYHHDITGIGIDSGSALTQSISSSINDDSMVVISATVGGDFVDGDFFVIGNDDGRLSGSTEVPAHLTDYKRLTRVWKVAESGGDANMGDLFIIFDLSSVSLDADADLSDLFQLRLLVHGAAMTPDFSNPDETYGPFKVEGNKAYFSISDDGIDDPPFNPANLDDGEYFTLAYPVAPEADLSVTQQSTAWNSGIISYTIVAKNAGPEAAPGAIISSTFPVELTGQWLGHFLK
jgi:hypothetical protein